MHGVAPSGFATVRFSTLKVKERPVAGVAAARRGRGLSDGGLPGRISLRYRKKIRSGASVLPRRARAAVDAAGGLVDYLWALSA